MTIKGDKELSQMVPLLFFEDFVRRFVNASLYGGDKEIKSLAVKLLKEHSPDIVYFARIAANIILEKIHEN